MPPLRQIFTKVAQTAQLPGGLFIPINVEKSLPPNFIEFFIQYGYWTIGITQFKCYPTKYQRFFYESYRVEIHINFLYPMQWGNPNEKYVS